MAVAAAVLTLRRHNEAEFGTLTLSDRLLLLLRLALALHVVQE